ncbi:MAG: tRNA uridine-5-carboxymethylaminomethyl(34) synthesis enzyme [Candidatus Paraimprobicoccus trichonymphae]|uniref:tRNA uridine 5-carboxymethylaminomethyl modification enzyme MnmG n=1 Tax=Candidatus Paraimprobicoccus trichonymphae TaxID=3033793 RepID=A0AA48HVX8_9FIRM|nr:MAG: tRNA uridine-5-carboxymethylaminomethyl(34) synthesis enzyme [Candidatus Paraimprobicoccus trichonymphae]
MVWMVINKFKMNFDIIVIGAGHAGIEAGLVSARLGCKTAIFSVNLDSVGNCPCNPSIGGTAKGHLVREIDALGGEMGKTTDECMIQSRMLNKSKGPAVRSLRAQIDRNKYKIVMKHKLELQENLELKQAEIIDLKKINNIWIIKTRNNVIYSSKAVIICTGTYLKGRVHIGEISYDSGPDGIFSADFLSKSLLNLNIKLKRFKTGTPARVLKSSINFSNLEIQTGDKKIVPFSFSTNEEKFNKINCYLTWTNENTKKVILKNIHRSPMYNGKISGIGPRYCPSIEDKIVRFSYKERHLLFIEPCGLDTEEMYLQGMSSSLPEEVQFEFYRTIQGLENVKIMRPAYAIEYDCVDSTQMNLNLEFKNLSGLYGAGQFNGSSGYEEAAAQGLVAGINAALKIKNKESLILDRASSYTGTLIDDLVTKGVNDPYRIMTSRSEYRLILRQDNADERLTPIGRKIGLISDNSWNKFVKKQELKKQELNRINESFVILENNKVNLKEVLKRPEYNYENLKKFDTTRPKNLSQEVSELVEIEVKYDGYIKRQQDQIEKMRNLESKIIPENLNYKSMKNLRLEAIEKLSKIKPKNIGQASRISGVNPTDITVLIIYLK